jgi:hypothetical protein
MYHWSAELGGPLWAWFTAWLNIVGLIAAMAGIDYGCAQFLLPTLGFESRAASLSLVYGIILLSQTSVNQYSTRPVGDSMIWARSYIWPESSADRCAFGLCAETAHSIACDRFGRIYLRSYGDAPQWPGQRGNYWCHERVFRAAGGSLEVHKPQW